MSIPKSVSQVIQELELRAPSSAAESWDNVGLLVGDPAWKTTGAIISIDLTREAIQKAEAKGFRLIITHHPCIFPKKSGLAKVISGNGNDIPSLVLEAIQSGIAIASYHTNFDRCAIEVIDSIANALEVIPKGRLLESSANTLMKLVVFVPQSHIAAVRSAVFEAGAGQVGNYDSCSFGVLGEGTFRGREGSHPFLGKTGHVESPQELRLETVFPKGMESLVLKAMRESHPYEEIAYDLYPITQAPASIGIVRGLGYGFWGEFPASKPFSDVSQDVKSLFKIDGFWLTGPPPKRVQRVGFVAGKGAAFVNYAATVGCDLLITGEVGYHAALQGMRQNKVVMELGHRESERFFLTTIKSWLSQMNLTAEELDLPVQKIWFG